MKYEYDESVVKDIKKEEHISEENYNLLSGRFFSLLTSQNGSRIIQSCISKTSLEVMSKIFIEVKDKLYILINDQYGNYFCKKFFCSITENERLAFLEHVKFINFYFYFLKLKNMKKWMKIIF